jgi:hypothetical protein
MSVHLDLPAIRGSGVHPPKIPGHPLPSPHASMRWLHPEDGDGPDKPKQYFEGVPGCLVLRGAEHYRSNQLRHQHHQGCNVPCQGRWRRAIAIMGLLCESVRWCTTQRSTGRRSQKLEDDRTHCGEKTPPNHLTDQNTGEEGTGEFLCECECECAFVEAFVF